MKLIIYISLILFALPLFSWEREYEANYTIRSMAQGANGDVILGGYFGWLVPEDTTYFFISDSLGDIRSSSKFLGRRGINALARCPDNGYVFADGAMRGGYLWFGRLDSFGDTLWTVTTSFPGLMAQSILWTSDDHILILTGFRDYIIGDDRVFRIIKADSIGNIEWVMNYDTLLYPQLPGSVIETSDGNYILSIEYASHSYLMKIDTSGAMLWKKGYGRVNSTPPQMYEITSPFPGLESGFLLGGSDDDHLTLIRTNTSGDSIWSREYSPPSYHGGVWGSFIAPAYSDERHLKDFVITGLYQTHPTGRSAIFILRIDDNLDGDTIWTRSYLPADTTLEFEPRGIFLCNDGGFVIGGTAWTLSYIPPSYPFLFKVDSLGNPATADIIEINSPLPTKPEISAHPNPFNSAVTITLDAPVGAIHELPLQIEIYDVNGRIVDKISVGEHLCVLPNGDASENGRAHRPSPTEKAVIWRPDASIGSGIYLVRATVGEETVSKKVIYIK